MPVSAVRRGRAPAGLQLVAGAVGEQTHPAALSLVERLPQRLARGRAPVRPAAAPPPRATSALVCSSRAGWARAAPRPAPAARPRPRARPSARARAARHRGLGQAGAVGQLEVLQRQLPRRAPFAERDEHLGVDRRARRRSPGAGPAAAATSPPPAPGPHAPRRTGPGPAGAAPAVPAGAHRTGRPRRVAGRKAGVERSLRLRRARPARSAPRPAGTATTSARPAGCWPA